MHLWGNHFYQNANQKLQGFLPYQTNKDCSTLFGDLLVSLGSFFWLQPLFVWQGRNPCNFWFTFWEKWWPHKFILNLTDLYFVLKKWEIFLEIRLFCEKVVTVPFFFRQIVEGLRHGQSFIKEKFGYAICFFGCIDRFWSERFQNGSSFQIIFLQFTNQIFQCQPYFKNSIFYLISH